MIHKKQAYNLVEAICTLNNNVWRNHKGSYDDAKESAYQIEEALEGFDLNSFEDIDSIFYIEDEGHGAKHLSNQLIDIATNSGNTNIADVDRFDKHLDSIYFNIGSLHKLGLTPAQIVDGLQVVHDANLQKSGIKDSNGKVGKPADFIPPEEKLQLILDKRHV